MTIHQTKPAPAGPLASAVSYTALKATDYYKYGKENISLVKYVGDKVEAPVAKAATVVQSYGEPALNYVDSYLVKTTNNVTSAAAKANELVVVKPGLLVSSVYGQVVQTCDKTVDYYLPAKGENEAVQSGASVRGVVGKVYTRLPLAVVDGAAYGRQTVLAAPSQAREYVSTAATRMTAGAQQTRELVEGKTVVLRDGVYARYVQVCDQTKAVLHTTVETVNGQTTAAFSLVQNGVQSRVVVPISSSLVWADSKFGISQRLAYTQGLLHRTVEPLLRSSLVAALSEKAAQLNSSTADLRSSVQKQIDVLLAVLHLSSKPATNTSRAADIELAVPATSTQVATPAKAPAAVTPMKASSPAPVNSVSPKTATPLQAPATPLQAPLSASRSESLPDQSGKYSPYEEDDSEQ
jgi:hypothetical protein